MEEELTEEDYRQALGEDPENFAALTLLGCHLRLLPEGRAEAQSLFRRALEFRPDNVELWVLLGGLLDLQPNKQQEAQDCYRRAVATDPRCGTGWVALGIGCIQRPEGLAEAEQCFEKARQAKPEWSEPWFQLGQVWLLQGQLAKAQAAFTRALELESDKAEAWAMLGETHDHTGGHEAAAECFHKALQLRPQVGDWWDRLGGLWLDHLESPQQARQAFERAMTCPGDPAYAQANLFWALVTLGEWEAARALRIQLSGLEAVGYDLCDAALALADGTPESIQPRLDKLRQHPAIQGEYACDWERLSRLLSA